jgi:hypothetical protein
MKPSGGLDSRTIFLSLHSTRGFSGEFYRKDMPHDDILALSRQTIARLMNAFTGENITHHPQETQVTA